jgi:alpha-tubulin suppressor-like RCC1 family protein
VKKIVCGCCCFAALRNDGRVVTWGMPDYGGDYSDVEPMLRDIVQIKSNGELFGQHKFQAIRDDGMIISWPSH